MKAIISTLILTLSMTQPQLYAEAINQHSTLISYTKINHYSTDYLEKVLTSELEAFETTTMGIKFPKPKNAVTLYKVIYNTSIPEKNNQPTIASGLIAIPDLPDRTLPIVSWQHGTVYTKK